MLTVAVTGGIGSGKSTVSRMLADLGAVVVDSDRLAREVVAPGTPGLAAVARSFGPAVLSADGSLDRAALAAIVFADPAQRAILEGVTHPLVRAAFHRERDAAAPGAIVVNDIPLVRTVAEAAAFHLVVGVGAGDDVRVRRLAGRGMAADDARSRMRAQIDDRRRMAISDIWIHNDGDERDLRGRVSSLWHDRLVPMAANVGARRAAARPAPVLVEPDAAWAALAELLCARVSAAAGGARCDHIGSTAVPGLPAKDVIDLQVAVPDIAAADAISDALADAGFPPVGDIDRDNPHGTGGDEVPGELRGDGALGGSGGDGVPGELRGDGAHGGSGGDGAPGWAKRFHANADPGRAVNLHVRALGAANWRWALLFRDWLRAEPSERAAYLAVKRAAASAHGGIAGYADAKEPWLAEADDRMWRWARETGWTPAPPGRDVTGGGASR